jgi:integrase
MTLPEFYERYYLPLRLVGKSLTTLHTYRAALRRWQPFSTVRIQKIDSRLLAAWQAWLLPGHSPATVNNNLRCVLTILRFAADEEVGVIPRVPRIKKLREMRRVPLALTVEEFAAVLDTASRQKYAPLWRALLLVAWETGLRLRGLLSLRPVDVLFDSGGLYCQASGMKNATAQWFSLSPITLSAIRTIWSLENERLFNFRIKVRQISKIMRRILDTSGIYSPHGQSFHRLRRSRASYVKLLGGDATAAMGHAHASTTLRYLDPRICGSATQPPMPMPQPVTLKVCAAG